MLYSIIDIKYGGVLRLRNYKDTIMKTIIIFSISILFVWFIKFSPQMLNILDKLFKICLPFIMGLLFAYILNPLVNKIENKLKVKRNYAIALTYMFIFTVLIFGMLFVVPRLYQSCTELINEIPYYITSIQEWFNNLLGKEEIDNIINMIGLQGKELSNILVNSFSKMGSILDGSFVFIKNVSTWTVSIVLGFLLSIYVLIDLDNFKRESKKVIYIVLKKEKAEKFFEFVKLYDNMICTYVGIKAIDSLIIGVIAFIALHLVGAKYATIIALVVGCTNMIPYFGPMIGEAIGFLLNVFASPTKGIIVFLCLFATQMFDAWYLDPKLVGGKVGVKPFFIILAIMIGGGFFGAIGMLLASPTMAVIKHYYVIWVEKHEYKPKEIKADN